MSGPATWQIGDGLNTAIRKESSCYEMLKKASCMRRSFGRTYAMKNTQLILAVVGVGVKGEGVTGEKFIMRRFMSRTPHQLLDCLALRSFATSGITSATSHRHVADDLQHHPRPNLYTRLHVAVTSANRSCVCR
jgi:hypothetical protein